MALFSGLSLLPDLDYVGVVAGLTDGGPCGHRGATHSLVPAVLVGLAALALAPRFGLPRWRLALLSGLTLASHPLLDSLTTGGRGVPLLWPFNFTRFSMPWQPIPDSPCGLAYFSWAGLRVAAIEAVLFLPILVAALRPASRAKTVPVIGVRAEPSSPTPPSPARITRQAV